MTYRFLTLGALALLAAGMAAPAQAKVETYEIDAVHSSINFKIRHFVARTAGNFAGFSGTITVNHDDMSKSKVEAVIDVKSIDTNNDDRDEHIMDAEYFNAAEYGEIKFVSTEWKTAGENLFHVTGDLTMSGQTHEVTLEVELLGMGPGRRGAQLSGWHAETKLDRTLWGNTGGRPAVGDDVEVSIDIEAILKS